MHFDSMSHDACALSSGMSQLLRTPPQLPRKSTWYDYKLSQQIMDDSTNLLTVCVSSFICISVSGIQCNS